MKTAKPRPIAPISLDQLRRITGGWVAYAGYTDDGKTLASVTPR